MHFTQVTEKDKIAVKEVLKRHYASNIKKGTGDLIKLQRAKDTFDQALSKLKSLKIEKVNTFKDTCSKDFNKLYKEITKEINDEKGKIIKEGAETLKVKNSEMEKLLDNNTFQLMETNQGIQILSSHYNAFSPSKVYFSNVDTKSDAKYHVFCTINYTNNHIAQAKKVEFINVIIGKLHTNAWGATIVTDAHPIMVNSKFIDFDESKFSKKTIKGMITGIIALFDFSKKNEYWMPNCIDPTKHSGSNIFKTAIENLNTIS